MSGMDSFLAEFYGTNKTASAAAEEDLEKAASVELFMKLASDQKIDLAHMPDAQVNALYNSWVQKTAAATAPANTQTKTASEEHEESEKKKREEAEKEHEEKKAASEKLAEADFLGRVMAHAYTNELRKIASGETGKTAGEMPEAFRKHLEGKKSEGGEHHETKKEEKEEHEKKEHEKKEGSAPSFPKTASPIDQLAADYAVKFASEHKVDVGEVTRKVAAVLELGLGSTEKSASAQTLDQRIGIRGLELLEAAGYPITWNNQ